MDEVHSCLYIIPPCHFQLIYCTRVHVYPATLSIARISRATSCYHRDKRKHLFYFAVTHVENRKMWKFVFSTPYSEYKMKSYKIENANFILSYRVWSIQEDDFFIQSKKWNFRIKKNYYLLPQWNDYLGAGKKKHDSYWKDNQVLDLIKKIDPLSSTRAQKIKKKSSILIAVIALALKL